MGTHNNNSMFTNDFTHAGACGSMYNNAFPASQGWQTQLNQGHPRHQRDMFANDFTHVGPCGTMYSNAFSANQAFQAQLNQERARHQLEMSQQREREREKERERERERSMAAAHAAALRNAVEEGRKVETLRKRKAEGLHLKLRCTWDASTTCILVRHDEQVASSIREKLFLPSNRGFSLRFEEGKDRMSLSRIAENKTTFQDLSLEQHATITVVGTPEAQTEQKRAKQRTDERQAVDPFAPAAPLDVLDTQSVRFERTNSYPCRLERTKSEQEFDAYFGAETIVWEPCFPPASTHAAPAC